MDNLNLTRSMQLYKEALEVIPGGSQTGSKRPGNFVPGAFPVYLQRGDGCRVWDVDGNQYIDYIGALGPITLGYCNPAVDQAVLDQLRQGMVFSLLHPLEVEAAQAVVQAVPCAEMVRFLKTGAEATSAAARIARAFTGRELIVSSGYHGWLDTWTALQGAPRDRGVPRGLKDSIAPFAFGTLQGDNCLEAVLERHRGHVACVLMEPVSYHDMASGDYLRWARELAGKHGAVLVFDEIVSGFRVALGGAQEYFGVTPDIACFAKGISNGLPVAAVAGKKEIMRTATDLLISTTYGGEALSLAAVSACLREYREKDVVAHLWRVGERLVAGMNSAAAEAGLRLEFRGYPVMSSFRFDYDDPQTNGDLMSLLLQEMAKRGVLLRRGGLVFVSYAHKDLEIDQTLETCREVFPLLVEAQSSGRVQDLLTTREVEEAIRRF